MNFPVIDTNGNSIKIVEKRLIDSSLPGTSDGGMHVNEVLVSADGKFYKPLSAGRVEEIDAPEAEDTPAAAAGAAEADLNEQIKADQAASAEATGPVFDGPDPLVGDVNEAAKAIGTTPADEDAPEGTDTDLTADEQTEANAETEAELADEEKVDDPTD